MPIQQTAVGAKLPSTQRAITVRDLLAYAAGIGETSPRALDDARGAFAAVPAYCVSLEWPVVSAPEARACLGAQPEELRRGVHFVQDSHFHAPIVPGAVLETEGEITEIRATSAGALSTTCLRTKDKDGQLVVESWTSSIYRGVETSGLGAGLRASGASALAGVAPNVPEPGKLLTERRSRVPIAKEMAHVYTECARIWNPIHTERRVAIEAGLPDIILHGTATWALAGREVVREFVGGDWTRLKRLHGRFTGMVLLGSEIEVVMAGEANGCVWFEVLNEQGQSVLSQGFARLSS